MRRPQRHSAKKNRRVLRSPDSGTPGTSLVTHGKPPGKSSSPNLVLVPDTPGVLGVARLALATDIAGLSSPPLDDLSTSFLAELALCGRAPTTLHAYRRDLIFFQRWARRGASLESWDQITNDVVVRFLSTEHERGAGLRLIARRIAVIRALLVHATLKGFTVPKITIHSKQSRPLPMSHSREDIANAIRCARGEDFFSLRDRAVLEILYGSGISSAELCALDVDAVDLQQALLRVDSKFLVGRSLPLHARAMSALRAWLSVRRAVPGGQSALALFVSAGGYRLGQDALSTICQRRSAAAGVVPVLTPRTIRNSFGVHLFDGGAQEHEVAALMGLSIRRAEDLFRAAHPLRRRGGEIYRKFLETTREPPSSQITRK
jgi:site-specific recombinase XerD